MKIGGIDKEMIKRAYTAILILDIHIESDWDDNTASKDDDDEVRLSLKYK